MQAATSANMALAGSATTLALDANYDHNDVTVTDLTNAMTVTYGGMGPDGVSTGSNLGTLTLSHTLPVGLGQVLNFTMDSTAAVAPLELTVDSLVVASSAPALALVAVDSTGNAALNQITDVNGVSANVTISGSTPINFGDQPRQRLSLVGGTIDASADTGTVTTFLSATTGAGTGVAAQTFIAGTGTNNVTVANSGGDVIDFSHGGTDTVTFTALPVRRNLLADTALHYNNVLGFTTAHDSIGISYRLHSYLRTQHGGPVRSRRRDGGAYLHNRPQRSICYRLTRQLHRHRHPDLRGGADRAGGVQLGDGHCWGRCG